MNSENKIQEQFLATDMIGSLGMQCERFMKVIRYILIFAGFAILCLSVTNYRYSQANEKNNQRWIEYLSQYDFVAQEGEGYNYFNSDIGGDVINGQEDTE